jgi:hypothetical protein
MTTTIIFPDAKFVITAEIARTANERTRGLSNRAAIPWDHGMLFVFDTVADHAFWMYETYIPLDVIFLDENFVVVGVVENMRPHDVTLRQSGRLSRYALEMNAGFARAYGIRVGQQAIEVAATTRPRP